ncbi:MAG: PAS domain S-box protein [Deltaproteobacteria bacterium]|nr:PAS domain S-box protein [Deltaproteobacteria bacterium]
MLNKIRQIYLSSYQPTRPPGNGAKAATLAEGLRIANPDCQPTIEVLLENDHDFKLLLNNIPAVVFKGYVDGSVDFFDQKIEALTGYPRQDFESRQRKWTELVFEEDIEAVKQAFVQGLKTDKSYVREYRIRDRNNNFLWIQERSQIVCDKSGKVQYVSGIFFDITSQKQTEEALQEGERFLSSIFGSILDGISVIDLNFTVVQVNPTMEKWYQHALPLVGEKCYEAQHGRSEPCQPCPAYRTMLTGEPHFETLPLKGDDGRSVGWVDVHAFPWLNKSTGKMKGVIKYIRDITYRVEAEQTVEESLKNLKKALKGTVKALSNTLESKDPYTASHQRRVVQLACALAQELGESPDYIEGIRVMGFLHDLGKIAVPGEILSKPSRLSSYEFNLIKVHPQAGYDILKDIDFPWPVALAVLQHHERLDGSGYPHGLAGHDIIPEAKILAVADVVEAISSHRPYRPALGIDQAMAEITRHQGVLYDPTVVQTCLRLFSEQRFSFN